MHVQSKIKNSTGTTSHTETLTPAPGSCILLWIRCSSTSTTFSSVGDNVDGAYTLVHNQSNGTRRFACFKLEHCTGGSRTITIETGATATLRIATGEYANDSVDDFANNTFTTTTTPAAAAVDSTVPGDTIISAIALDGDPTTIDAASGETERQQAAEITLQFQDRVVGDAGPYTAAWTLGATQPGLYSILALKPSAQPMDPGALSGGMQELSGGMQ